MKHLSVFAQWVPSFNSKVAKATLKEHLNFIIKSWNVSRSFLENSPLFTNLQIRFACKQLNNLFNDCILHVWTYITINDNWLKKNIMLVCFQAFFLITCYQKIFLLILMMRVINLNNCL